MCELSDPWKKGPVTLNKTCLTMVPLRHLKD